MSTRRRDQRRAQRRRAADPHAGLDAAYAQVPGMLDCQGLCHSSCGPIPTGEAERQRIADRHGVTIPVPNRAALLAELVATGSVGSCPALTADNRCAVYADRPLICFRPDAYVYTESGPRQIAEVLAGDRVYGSDGRLHRVTATASRWYDGHITGVRHSGTHAPCWSTTDHRWLVASQKDKRKTPEPRWKAAGELTAKRHHQLGDYLTFPRTFQDRPEMAALDVGAYAAGTLSSDGLTLHPLTTTTFPDRSQAAVPARLAVDEPFLYMLGMYIAEGSASNSTVAFTLSITEEHIAGRLIGYLAGIGLTSTVRRTLDRNTLNVLVTSAVYARLMRALAGVGSADKRIHPDVFAQLSHGQLWQVFEAWNEGDGRKCSNEQQISVSTTSLLLAHQMSFAALANGYFPRLYRTDRRLHPRRPAWDLNLFPSNWRGPKANHGTRNMADDDYTYTPAADAVIEQYVGPVIDIQVEGAESFVTTSGIAHNCRLWGAVEDLRCPYGCLPAGGYLTRLQARDLMRTVMT